jgi:hypothetical protein
MILMQSSANDSFFSITRHGKPVQVFLRRVVYELFVVSNQGCQIFLGTIFQNGEKSTTLPQKIQTSIKYIK